MSSLVNLGTSLIIILFLASLFYFVSRKFKKMEDSSKESEAQKLLLEWLKSMQVSLDSSNKNTQASLETISKTLGDSLRNSTVDMAKVLQENSKQLNERLDRAGEVIAGVQRNLGAMQETTSYLKDLHQILQAPKLRGNIGEQILYDLLKQHLPIDSVKLQHPFRSGEKVDALIVTAQGSIPVDSKFPMESFKRYLSLTDQAERDRAAKDFVRDVKKHVDDISRKYILPEEGTIDCAIMYVPSEPVAYEIITNFHDLLDYCQQKGIVLASPNTFTQFLKMTLLGFEREKVESQAKQILNSLKAIRIDATKFGEDLRLTVKHITNAKNSADEASSSFSRLEGKISLVQLTSPSEGSPLD